MGYCQVHFCIKSGYEAYSGWADDQAAEQFRAETRSLFGEAGWTLQPGSNGVCDTVTKRKQDLYLHPMNFSGVIQGGEHSRAGDSYARRSHLPVLCHRPL